MTEEISPKGRFLLILEEQEAHTCWIYQVFYRYYRYDFLTVLVDMCSSSAICLFPNPSLIRGIIVISRSDNPALTARL